LRRVGSAAIRIDLVVSGLSLILQKLGARSARKSRISLRVILI